MKTRLTELFGIDVPIVLPGMSWISKAELVAAVSEAGGLVRRVVGEAEKLLTELEAKFPH